MPRPSEDEELPQLGKSVTQPLSVALGHADHRRGHRDQLVGLDPDKRSGLGLADARRREQERRGYSEHRGEAREDGGAWLLDAASFELSDRRSRDTDAASELSLSKVQSLARRSHCEGQRRP